MPMLPLPECLVSPYLLPTTAPPPDVAALAAAQVRQRLGPPLRDRVLALLADGHVTVEVCPADDFPALEAPWLTAFGATESELRALRTASHVVLVDGAHRPRGPSARLWAGRAVAYALACGLSAPVVDERLPHLLDARELVESLPGTDGVLPMSRWVMALQSPGARGYRCTTSGLDRFGLPELQVLDVPASVAELWAVTITALAQRLVQGWDAEVQARPGTSFVELPDVVTVSPADVEAAYRRRPAGRGTVELRLTLEVEGPRGPTFLTVREPDHLAVCDALFGALER
jgi:hypothetical protein